MADMISGIQSALVTLFQDAKTATPANAPKVIEAYNGQLQDPNRLVRNMPALYVDVTSDFTLDGADVLSAIHSGSYSPEVILFDKNNLNKEKTIGEMAVLIDWTIAALRGKTITVGGIPITVADEIRGRYLGDLVPAAVLTLSLGTSEDEI